MNKETLNLENKFEELKKKYLEKKNDEVIEGCNDILKKNKIDVFYNLLCLAHNNKGNFLEAINVMKNALKQNPKNADFFNNPEEIVFRSISQIIKIVGKKHYPPRGKKIDRLLYLIKNNNSSFKVSLGNCLIKKVNKTIIVTKAH